MKDTYLVQTRSQTRAKAANASEEQNTSKQPTSQGVTPKNDQIPDNKMDQDSKTAVADKRHNHKIL